MTKVAVLLHGGSNYVLGDRVDLFTNLESARFVYETCEHFGFDPRSSVGTPLWGEGHEAGAEVGWAWKHDHDNAEVIEAEKNGAPLSLNRFTGEQNFGLLSPDYVLVKLPRGGYKWKPNTA